MNLKSLIGMGTAALLLAACGGGGSSSSAAPEKPAVITPPDSGIMARGFTFAQNEAFFKLTQQQRLELVALPVFEIAARASKTEQVHLATESGGGMLSARCSTRSSCVSAGSADVIRVELSDSSQLRLCNGSVGSLGEKDVYICVDSEPFSETEMSIYLVNGKIIKKTLRYKPA
ncbi:hypothetical protein [Janthinobacterium sp. PAMC25594]|uniref:hypothetical protein n=1 Tax=Janthinobacterium sp. PAMC25594 TaxID=2861284 RepID=UPI001C637D7A|nr:hypothetical protein [Janthinobacterium sp. PAMC25594]QYG10365.1 hypothetical protein KY494_17015 [Janthinobacterium sp. PAMC25594]